jgi:hypothetical protein
MTAKDEAVPGVATAPGTVVWMDGDTPVIEHDESGSPCSWPIEESS